MRHYFTLLGHEVRMLLFNPGTYVAAVLFLAIMGFVFTGILENYSRSAQETAPAVVFFQTFWLPVLFMVPLLTMKCISEERRLGTLETLLTTPVTTAEVVLAKFSAAYLLYIGLWASTGGFFRVLSAFADDPRLLDPAVLAGGYAFVAVSGLFFVAVGVFASSLSRNQAVSGIAAFTFLFALIVGTRFVSSLEVFNLEILRPAREVLDHLQVFRHLDDFSRGIIDTRQLLFYVSGAAVSLILSVLAIEAKLLQG
jgi:ABC-2 type transport system permease protein